MKIRPVRAEMFCADAKTHDEFSTSFSQFRNTHKNWKEKYCMCSSLEVHIADK